MVNSYNFTISILLRYVLFIPTFLITSALVIGSTQWVMLYYDNWFSASFLPVCGGMYISSIFSASVFPGKKKHRLVVIYLALYLAFYTFAFYWVLNTGKQIQDPFDAVMSTIGACIGFLSAYIYLKKDKMRLSK